MLHALYFAYVRKVFLIFAYSFAYNRFLNAVLVQRNAFFSKRKTEEARNLLLWNPGPADSTEKPLDFLQLSGQASRNIAKRKASRNLCDFFFFMFFFCFALTEVISFLLMILWFLQISTSCCTILSIGVERFSDARRRRWRRRRRRSRRRRKRKRTRRRRKRRRRRRRTLEFFFPKQNFFLGLAKLRSHILSHSVTALRLIWDSDFFPLFEGQLPFFAWQMPIYFVCFLGFVQVRPWCDTCEVRKILQLQFIFFHLRCLFTWPKARARKLKMQIGKANCKRQKNQKKWLLVKPCLWLLRFSPPPLSFWTPPLTLLFCLPHKSLKLLGHSLVLWLLRFSAKEITQNMGAMRCSFLCSFLALQSIFMVDNALGTSVSGPLPEGIEERRLRVFREQESTY